MIPKMIEAVHFNDQKPENLNKDDVIKSLVSEKYIILDKHFEDKSKTVIEEFVKENYVKFRDIYSKDKNIAEKIQNDCELVLLNNR